MTDRLRRTGIFHFAWDVALDKLVPGNFDWVAASLKLYRAFVEAGSLRRVVTGTCAEYDRAFNWLNVTNALCRSATTYNAAKGTLPVFVKAAVQSFAFALVAPVAHNQMGPVNSAYQYCSPLLDTIVGIFGRQDHIRFGSRPIPACDQFRSEAATTILHDVVGSKAAQGLQEGGVATATRCRTQVKVKVKVENTPQCAF